MPAAAIEHHVMTWLGCSRRAFDGTPRCRRGDQDHAKLTAVMIHAMQALAHHGCVVACSMLHPWVMASTVSIRRCTALMVRSCWF
jgi:hypothetical protein